MTLSTPGYGITFPNIYAPNFWAMGIVMPTVCAALTFLRLYTKRLRSVYVGWDDVFSLGALIGIIGMGVCFCDGAAHKVFGYPTRPANMSQEEAIMSDTASFQLLQKLEFAFDLSMSLSYGFIKLSIVCFCRRLFVVHKKSKFDIISLSLAWLIAVWTVVLICLYIAACPHHFDAIWGSSYSHLRQCNSLIYYGQWGMAATDLFLDLLVWCLPLPMIWQLKLSTTSKLSLTGIFIIGIVAIATSIARLILYNQVLRTNADPKEDVWLTIVMALYWSFLEAGVSFIAASLPTLNSLVRDERFKARIRRTFSIITFRSSNPLIVSSDGAQAVCVSASFTDGVPRPSRQKDQVRTELSSIAILERG